MTTLVKRQQKSVKLVGLQRVRRPKRQQKRNLYVPRYFTNGRGRTNTNVGLYSQYTNKDVVVNSPQVRKGDRGSIIVTNSEFFASVTAADQLFHILSYPIQPGMSTLFPWLSSIANSYDGYKIIDMAFEFKTNSGSANTGHILMGVDYDSHDDTPATEQQLSQHTGAVPKCIWEPSSILHYDIRKNGFYNKHYTRCGSLIDSDIKTYDSGNFQFGYISGTNITIGTLWIHYTIELFNPQEGNVPGGLIKLTSTEHGVDVTHVCGTSWANCLSNPKSFPAQRSGAMTMVFVAPFEGIINWIAVGTDITALLITTTATEILNIGAVITALLGMESTWVRAQPGDTLTFTPTATTITQSQFYFGTVKPSQNVF